MTNACLNVRYGESYGQLPVPVRKGYRFGGWLDADGNIVTESSIPTCDQTLVAKWDRYEYNRAGFAIYDGWLLDYSDRNATALVVPEGVVGIGPEALAGMWDLQTVTLPKSLKYIAEGAFWDDGYLDNLVIPDGVETIGDRAFEDCSYLQTFTLGKSVKSVGARAFAGCTQLQKVSFEEGLETIGDCAFSNCWRMASVSLPLSTSNVAWTAFTQCRSLVGVRVPTHMASFSYWFAPVAEQIRDVTIPVGETGIGYGAFEGFSSLRNVVFESGVGENATNGVLWIDDLAFCGCKSLEGIELPESLQHIGNEAFRDCTALKAMALPQSVSWLGDSAFRGCSALSSLTLSKSLASLSDYVLYGCDALDSFTVPESVTYLGRQFASGSNRWCGPSAIYYLGNAPSYDAEAYAGTRGELTSYVVLGTRGWDGRASSRDIPAEWPVDNANAREIKTWSPNPFDVTFDANGGVFLNDGSDAYACEQISYTAYALPPYNPKRDQSIFDGWWTEPVGGAKVTSSTLVTLTKAHTLYAHWIVGGRVRVRFNATGGTVLPEAGDYTTGVPFGELPVPTREYWDFDGWWTEAAYGTQIIAASEVPAADVELFAHWVPARYTIVYHSENGYYGSTRTQTFTYGETVKLYRNYWSCGSATFGGWATEPGGPAVYADEKTLTEISDVRDGEIHLYAVWIGDSYSVRFDSNGGVGRMDNQTMMMGVTYALNTNLYTRSGYTFKGWALTSSGSVKYKDGARVSGLSSVKNDTVVLYAVWEAVQTYTVTFKPNGGTCSETVRYVAGGTKIGELPVPTWSGYSFRCWTSGSSGGTVITPETVINSSHTYYAQWDKDVVSTERHVTFDAAGGTSPETSRTVTAGNAIGTLPTPTRDKHKFLGWYTAKDGGSKVSATTKVTADVTYYAHWELLNQSVVVAFDPQYEGGEVTTRSVVSGNSIGTLPAYSRKGYTFDGWYSEPVGGIKIAASTKVTGNMTCYAHATPIRYTVRFNANGGVGSMSDQEFAYDEEKELSRNQFVMAGRTFLGWSRRSSGYVNLFDPFNFYPDEEEVANLAEKSGEIVNLYAVWSDPSRASTFRLSKTVDDGYVWTTSVTVYRGESHLFWIEGVVRDDDCGLDLDVVACDDDSLYASEYWKFENAQGGHDHYVLLSEDDWMWSNISVSAVRFRVTVSAWDSCANSTLRFGHMSGSIPVELTWRVTFDPGEGDLDWHGAMPVGYAKTVEYKNNAALGTLEVPTRSRYKFLGWFTSESGGTKVTASTKVTADVTYYAHWERNSSRCVATLDANGGECDVASVDTVWNKPFGELPVAVRWGYLFAGWYTDPEFGIRVDETSIVEDDVVLYAHWSLIHGQFEAGKMYGRNDSGAQAEDWRTVFEYARRSHVPIVFLIGGKECVWCRKVHDAFLDSGEWEVPCIMYYDYYTNNPRPAEYALFGNFQWDGGTFPALCCYWNIGDGKSVMKAVSLMNGSYGRCIDSDNGTIDKNLILQIIEATFECPLANATDEQPILLYPPDKTTDSDGYVLIRITEYAISDSQLKFTVKGLPSGVKFDAKTGVISGTATKPGVYKVTVSATNATVKKPVTAEFEIVVPNLTSEKLPGLEQDKDAYGVVMCGVALPTDLVDCTPGAGWTVKVAGLPAGLKFTAKDIMKKGSKTEVEIPANTIYGVPTKTGTFTVTFTATKGKEKQVATITLNVEELPLWAQGTFTGYVAGTRDACPYRGFATMTVAANGKISGKIALDGTNWTFSAASFSRVEHVERVEGGVATNFVVEAVAKAGKVERKVALEVSGHAGRVTLPGGCFIETALPNAVAGGTFGEGEVKMWRGMWKDKATAAAAKTAIEKFIGVYTVSIADGADYGSGYLSLTVGKDGNVKASGKLADGTSVSATSPLMCDEDAGWLVMLYAAPSAYKGGAFAAAVGFYADDAAVAGRPLYRLTPALFAPQWSSRNVQATDEYGEGFDRAVGLVGAYYDKLDTLRKYYESMRVRLDDTPELFFSYKGTYLDENNRKVTETFLDSVWAVDTLGQPGLTAAVNEKGAIVVEKATKPVQDKATKEWLYEGRNDGALTLSFAQATGIFKGSYTFWYDYESAYDETTGKSTMVHTSKKVSFEGILVQGELPKMDGFYLWDATGEYEDEKTGKAKTYKYKQSFPVSIRP